MNKLVEKDRKRLWGIIKSDDVNKLKQLNGLICDENGNLGYVNQRMKSGKSHEPLVQCIESNSEDCFNFILSVDGLELHKYYYLYEVLSYTNNMRFFDKILDQPNFEVEKCLRFELRNRNINIKKIKKLLSVFVKNFFIAGIVIGLYSIIMEISSPEFVGFIHGALPITFTYLIFLTYIKHKERLNNMVYISGGL